MATDPEILYRQLGCFVNTMPDVTQAPQKVIEPAA